MRRGDADVKWSQKSLVAKTGNSLNFVQTVLYLIFQVFGKSVRRNWSAGGASGALYSGGGHADWHCQVVRFEEGLRVHPEPGGEGRVRPLLEHRRRRIPLAEGWRASGV